MKRLLLYTFSLVLLQGVYVGAKAQSIQAINPPTIVYGTTADNLLTVNVDVTNTTQSNVNVMAKRVENSIIPGSVNYFCWIQCYAPSVDQSPSPLPISAGDTVPNFYADYQPMGNEGSSFIDYCFFDYSHPEDESCFTVEYRIAGTSSIKENDAVVVGSPQPNPAVDRTQIFFDLKQHNSNAHLVIYNILGSKMKSVPVTGTSGKIDLNVSDLQSGVYIYSFFNGGKMLSSSRLVVR